MQSLSFDDAKLRRISSFKYECSCLTGLSILPDGKILICDYMKTHVSVVDETGNLVSTIPIAGKDVLDVAVIDEYTIAVTSGLGTAVGSAVTIVDIQSSSIKRSISMPNGSFGVAYCDQYIYCCVRGKGIVKISVNTGDSSTIYATDMSYWAYITYQNNKLYFTDLISFSVTCCDMEGCEIWKLEEQVGSQRGIAVCKFGFIFLIADKDTNSVMMLSEDGKKSKEILTEDDGLSDPQTVFYDSERDRLLVGNEKGEVHIYKFV